MFCVVVFCSLLLCVGLPLFGLCSPMLVVFGGLPLCPVLLSLRISSVNCCFRTFGCEDVLFRSVVVCSVLRCFVLVCAR